MRSVFRARTVIFFVAATGCGRLGYDYIDVSAASNTGADGGGNTGGGGTSDGAGGGTNLPGNDASAGAGGRGGAAGSGSGGSMTGSGGANSGSGGTGVATGGTGTGGTAAGGTAAGGTAAGGTGTGGAMSSGGAGGVVNTPVPVSTVSQAVTGQSTVSWQHNVGNEANAFLVVSVSLRAFAGVRTVTVTINGSTPVSLGTMMFTNNAFAGMYGSVAPPNSTMTVNVNVNNTTSIVGGSRLYANVDPTNPVTNTAGYTALVNGTSIGVTVPGAIATSGTRLVDTVALAWEYPMTAGATQTVDWNLSLASGSQLSAGASHAAGAGSDFTFNWAFTTQSACIVANALNPAR